MATTSKKKSTAETKTIKKVTAAKAVAPSKSAASAKAAPKEVASKSSGNGTDKRQSKSQKGSDNIITHDMIASKAYHIWAQNGYPHGMEMQNWLQAEQELRANA